MSAEDDLRDMRVLLESLPQRLANVLRAPAYRPNYTGSPDALSPRRQLQAEERAEQRQVEYRRLQGQRDPLRGIASMSQALAPIHSSLGLPAQAISIARRIQEAGQFFETPTPRSRPAPRSILGDLSNVGLEAPPKTAGDTLFGGATQANTIRPRPDFDPAKVLESFAVSKQSTGNYSPPSGGFTTGMLDALTSYKPASTGNTATGSKNHGLGNLDEFWDYRAKERQRLGLDAPPKPAFNAADYLASRGNPADGPKTIPGGGARGMNNPAADKTNDHLVELGEKMDKLIEVMEHKPQGGGSGGSGDDDDLGAPIGAEVNSERAPKGLLEGKTLTFSHETHEKGPSSESGRPPQVGGALDKVVDSMVEKTLLAALAL